MPTLPQPLSVIVVYQDVPDGNLMTRMLMRTVTGHHQRYFATPELPLKEMFEVDDSVLLDDQKFTSNNCFWLYTLPHGQIQCSPNGKPIQALTLTPIFKTCVELCDASGSPVPVREVVEQTSDDTRRFVEFMAICEKQLEAADRLH